MQFFTSNAFRQRHDPRLKAILTIFALLILPITPLARPTHRNVPVLPASIPAARINVAAAANGGMATASSTTPSWAFSPATFSPGGAIDGGRVGWGNHNAWRDFTSNAFPDWLQIDFNGSKSIDEIDVITLQDNENSTTPPTETMTFSLNGITAFEVQYWSDSSWVTVPGGSVSGNDKVWKKFTFEPVTTSRIRVLINAGLNSNSRIVEVEAYGTAAGPARTNFGLAANGGVAVASSTTNDLQGMEFQPSSVNDGDRSGWTYPHNGFWRDGTNNAWPDWIELDFNGNKTIDEIDVFAVQDTIEGQLQDPTETMTFSLNGITAFDVQYWDGVNWVIVPEGNVTGNNKVWRRLTFGAISTSKIRVTVNAALNTRSRVVELEAWGTDPSLYEEGFISEQTGSTQGPENVRLLNRIYNTDFAAFGMGSLRDVGYGSLAVSNVVGTVRQAFLYWHGPTGSAYYNFGSSVLVNGIRAYGTPIGTSDDNNWCCGYVNSQAYRADITSLVVSNPNKYYTLSSFAEYAPAYPVRVNQGFNPNGASLVVFYDDGYASNNRDVSIYDGNDSNELNYYDADGWNVFLPGIEYASGQAILQLHVSDGQSYLDPSVAVNSAPFLSGYSFQGFTVPSGNGSYFFDNLWDIRSFDVTSYLHTGVNNLSITSPRPFGADALSMVVALVSVPAVPPEVKITNSRVSGYLNGTTQNALLGADIALNANIVPSGAAGGSYLWTFTGPAILHGSPTSPSVVIHSTSTEPITARVTYTRNGISTSGLVTINPALPTLTTFTAQQGRDLVQPPYGCNSPFQDFFYRLGCIPPTDIGIHFDATVQAPANLISDPAQSGVKYVQLISPFRKRIRAGNLQCHTRRSDESNVNSGWMLDTDDPYVFDEYPIHRFSEGNIVLAKTVDYPKDLLTGIGNIEFVDSLFIDDRFEMYVVYFTGSDATNSPIQRPLGKLIWNWGGLVVFDRPGSHQKRFTNAPPTNRIGVATNSMTAYQGNVKDVSYILCPNGPPPATSRIDTTRRFIQEHYLGFLKRQPDEPGWNNWTSEITYCAFDLNCIATRRHEVSKSFLYSSEIFLADPDLAHPPGTPGFDPSVYNPAFVWHLYDGYLDREPEPEGLDFWTDVLDHTGDYDGVMDAFLYSTEYRIKRFGL